MQLRTIVNKIFIVAFIVWVSFFPEPIQEKYHLATKVFLVLMFAMLLIKKQTSIFKLNDLPFWFFLTAIGINVFFAQNRNIAFKTYFDLVIPLFSIYYWISEVISDEINLRFLTKIFSIFSILVSLGGFLEFLFAVNPIYKYFIQNPYYERYIVRIVRPMSTQFNPVTLGTYLLASLPFNFLLLKQDKGLFKSLGTIGMILNTVVIILTFSRGVLLGLLASIVAYLFLQKKYRLLVIFFLILFISITVCSFLPYPFSRFSVNWLGTQNRGILSDYRFDRCIMALRIIRTHPFVGLGLQHFRIRFYEYYPRKNVVHYEFMIADNMYLTILSETGIIGFCGFLIFIFYFLKRSLFQLKQLNNVPFKKGQLLVIVSAFVGLLVNMGAYELFYWSNQYICFCILIGCLRGFLQCL